MQSNARERLAIQFQKLEIGQNFHLVNTVMNAAVPGTATFQRIETEFDDDDFAIANAVRKEDGFKVKIRDAQPIELIN